ncbi:inositol hexakisphosphate and diphosphoinositol-pentakisphosphate kinase [Extremus antarcticus]|uniref:Inositol hexakisphosphate and diphosphoinositol-pentakisphosphate kinase n=1 Tax=Extremus antarcticus TaxID=702011 RepID=A0AAJ0GCQ6_9PEZI|nr:inositol hexakisphosphate and diphosphoinositol-pentakisphosphate kinase [Extremus antarcticus]
MASNTEPLSRTVSGDSERSQSAHKLLQRAPSSQHKSPYAEIEPSSGDVERASISMPPPALKPAPRAQRISSNPIRTFETTIMNHISGQEDETVLPPLSLKAQGGPVQNLEGPLPGSQLESTISRRSDPEILDMKRMSVSSFYNLGGRSAPSSVAGSSDQDGGRSHVDAPAVEADEQAAQADGSNKATTATQNLSVTAQSHNGALSPLLNSSLKEPQFISSTTQAIPPASLPVASPASPTPSSNREGRQARGPSMERAALEKNPNRIGTIGICALDSKARSKPSRNILNRLVGKDNDFDVIIFGDKVILDEDVENWPVCDFLICFFSEGFPLDKAIAYAKLRRPFCVNDVPMQTVLWDRRLCLSILDKLGVPTPPRLEVSRDGGPMTLSTDISQRMRHLTGIGMGGPEGRGGGMAPPKDIHMEDDDDTLVVDGHRLTKPFVEKPVSGEDHNINIYYPKSQGGGGRRLFRKVNNKSSEKDETLVVPLAVSDLESSFVYEQFLKVENAEDVKAYTVGTEFCHSETRKSPVVDGVVKRNPNGKEIRYVTSLTKEEQIMAAKIASGFGQRVCGFDLLRVGDASYVIDVNGWSFVKDNNDYYDKAASILKAMFTREKSKWDGRTTPSETDEKEYGFPPTTLPLTSAPSTSVPDTSNGSKKHQAGKDGERGSHRNALKSVFRSRSISQLRDHVSQAAHKMGHPQSARSPSGTASPITSPPTLERTGSWQKLGSASVPKHESLPPPAVAASHSNLSAAFTERPVSSGTEAAEMVIDPPSAVPAPASKSQWKLKGMVAVIRHADRTPKQKFKFTFHSKYFADLLKGHQEEVLLVGEAALKSVQLAVKQALDEGLEDAAKLRVLQNALAKKGSWPGTKVQIKPMFKKPKEGKDEVGDKVDKDGKEKKEKNDKKVDGSAAPAASVPLTGPSNQEQVEQWQKQITAEPASFTEADSGGPAQVHAQIRSDSLGDVTLSRAAAADNNLVLDKLQLIMKWGGEPTHSARYQAAELGDNMRNDLLLMNRDVLDDVRIFSSSERRVTTSAQIFAGTFLDEKDVEDHHIRVRKDLLDDSNAAKDEMDKVKKKLKGLLRQGYAVPEQFAWPKNTPEPYVVVRNVVDLMKFHRRVMKHNLAKLQSSDAVNALERVKNPSTADMDFAAANGGLPPTNPASAVQSRWCTGEDAELFKERWEKLFDEFTDPEKVDPSKVSELYDTMKFDALHNRPFLEWIFTPSQSILLEEEGELSQLTRTESVVAREEFAQTHDGSQPNTDAKGEHEIKKIDKCSRSGTASTTASVGPTNEKEKQSLSQKMGFRRKSADLKSVARTAMAGENAEDSYFKLFKGNGSTAESKLRSDIRLEKLNELYGLSKILFDFIGPQEYGITDSEKLEIGLLTSLPLLKEIVTDLEEVQASDDAKSFIYFTKESHIYTLLNCILEGGVQTKIARNAIPELDYLSQICFELYESENAEADIDPSNPESNFNYSIRISISPGCHTFDPLDVQLDSKHCIGNAPRRTLTPHGNWKDVLETLRAKFHTVKLPKSFVAINLSEKIPQEFVKGEDGAEEEDVAVEASPIAPAH